MNARRFAVGALGSIGVLVIAASTAWACVSGPAINLSTIQAKPGDEVTVNGTGFRLNDKVLVRFNALDGPVVAELPRPENQRISATFTVPHGTAPGNYVVIVSQVKPDGTLALSPIRALLSVVGPTGQAPVLGADTTSDATVRPQGLVRSDSSVSNATLALIALGVAGVGMFVAGIAALATSRRATTATPVPVAKR